MTAADRLKTLSEEEARRIYEQERLIVWTTEAIAEAMEETGLAKADIAGALGKTRAHITQVLGGTRNMTLRTLADLAYACGKRAGIALEPLRASDFLNFPVPSINRRRPRVVAIESPGLDMDQRLFRLDDEGDKLAA